MKFVFPDARFQTIVELNVKSVKNKIYARNKPEVVRINGFSANCTPCTQLYVPLFRHSICNHFSYNLKKEILK